MTRPTSIREALANAPAAPAPVVAQADPLAAPDPAAQLDRLVALRDSDPDWFRTLPATKRNTVDTWAARRALQSQETS